MRPTLTMTIGSQQRECVHVWHDPMERPGCTACVSCGLIYAALDIKDTSEVRADEGLTRTFSFGDLYACADRVLTACGFYHLTPTEIRLTRPTETPQVVMVWGNYGIDRTFEDAMFLGGELELVGAWFEVPVNRVNLASFAQVSFTVAGVKVVLVVHGEPETEGD